LRTRHDLIGTDDVDVIEVTRADVDTFTTFRTPLGRRRVAIRLTLGSEERLTCHSQTTERPPRYDLIEDVAAPG
jgi:hypothetical protein